jgi:hypothetical protein
MQALVQRALPRRTGQARLPGSACVEHMSYIKQVYADRVMMTGSPRKVHPRTHHVNDNDVHEALHCEVGLPAARGATGGQRLQADRPASSHMPSVHHTPATVRGEVDMEKRWQC